MKLAGTEESPSPVPRYVKRVYHFDAIVQEHRSFGRHFGRITIRSHPAEAPLYRPVEVEIHLRKDVWAEPATLLANLDPSGEMPSWRIRLYSRSPKKEFDIQLPRASADWLAVDFAEEDQQAKSESESIELIETFLVHVTSLPDTVPAKGSITIPTGNIDAPELVIPVILLRGQEAAVATSGH